MQLTDTLMMVRPHRFGYNAETAVTNTFQANAEGQDEAQIEQQALNEFDVFVQKLRAAGVNVIVMDDPGAPHTPDSLFPNNWVSFHESGRVVLYPMQAHSRRHERRRIFLDQLAGHYGFRISDVLDLSYFEEQEKYLEGTGSMILDREYKIAYASRSPRTHPEVLEVFCRELGYTPFLFDATDDLGVPIYHTNVLMSVGQSLAILCLEAMTNAAEAARLVKQLEQTGKIVVPISMAQLKSFSGNMLHVRTQAGEPLLVVSEQGYQALDDHQHTVISSLTQTLHTNLNCIERYGGGSARCMLAEVFLPKQSL